jgi:hypothetical protein
VPFPVEVKVKGGRTNASVPTRVESKSKARGCAVRTPSQAIAENATQGILRLRNCFASRSSCCAQDDNAEGRVTLRMTRGEGIAGLGEFEAVGGVEVMPGFAVGVVAVGLAAAFGAEGDGGRAEDVREREDEPGVFGDDVGGEEIDFGEGVGDGASVDAAVGVDAVEAVLELGGRFDLDADEARARGGRKQVPFGALRLLRAGSPLRSLSLRFGRDDRCDVRGVENNVVAFAVAVGAGDAEAVAGGGQGEGEFRNFSAAFGGEFALEWSLRAGSLRGESRGRGESLGTTWLASAGSALALGHEIESWVLKSWETSPENEKAQAVKACANFLLYIFRIAGWIG